jgi:uncharacterized membrane protein
MFLAITSIGWGFNWPIMKYLLSELPPLTMRGLTGVAGASLLALLAILSGQSLRVPRELWPRLLLAAILNVACWMTLMGLALLWLPASEAALIAYTMPVWASLLAWPILGERPNLLRVISLVMAFAGLAAIMAATALRRPLKRCRESSWRSAAPSALRSAPCWPRSCRSACRRCQPPPGRSESDACRWQLSAFWSKRPTWRRCPISAGS